jgi:hypothetical protein
MSAEFELIVKFISQSDVKERKFLLCVSVTMLRIIGSVAIMLHGFYTLTLKGSQ